MGGWLWIPAITVMVVLLLGLWLLLGCDNSDFYSVDLNRYMLGQAQRPTEFGFISLIGDFDFRSKRC